MVKRQEPEQLVCDECGCEFERSLRTRSTEMGVFCSPVCSISAETSLEEAHRHPVRGPCGTCGYEFYSETERQYCSIECFTQSEEYSSVRAEMAERSVGSKRVAWTAPRECAQCGQQYVPKFGTIGPQMRGMFCSPVCTRRYSALRYDRWFANPKTLRLLQGYDEFLTANELLPCLYPGCEWRGHHLTIHMGMSHGVPKYEFKRAAGFSRWTGVTSPKLKQANSLLQTELSGAKVPKMRAGRRKVPQNRRWGPEGPKGNWSRKEQTLTDENGVATPPRVLRQNGAAVAQTTDTEVLKYKSREMKERRAKVNSERIYSKQCEDCGGHFLARHAARRECYTCHPEGTTRKKLAGPEHEAELERRRRKRAENKLLR